MADKIVTRREPLLRDCQIVVDQDADGFYAQVSYSQEGGIGGAVTVRGADLNAAQRAAGQTFLAAILVTAKAKWGGYGS